MKNFLIRREIIFDCLCTISIYIFSLRVIFVSSIFQVLGSIFIFPYLIYKARHIDTNNNGFIIYFGYMIITLLFSIFNIFFTSNGIGGCLILLATFGLGLYSIENLNKIRLHILIILIINMIYIVYQILYLGLIPNQIYEQMGLSRNHGGLLLCLLVGFYCYIDKITRRSTSVILPLFAMLCAYLLAGRSSLGLLAGLFLLSLIAKRQKTIIVLLSLILVSVLFYFKEDIELLYEASSFAEHGMESERFLIWSTYIDNLTIKSCLFGLDTETVPYIRDFGGNPHNSFFNFHRRIGIIPLLLFLIISCFSLMKYLSKRQYYIVGIIIIIYSRIFFDSDCFIGSYDYVIYAMIFYPIINKLPQIKIIKRLRKNNGIIESGQFLRLHGL